MSSKLDPFFDDVFRQLTHEGLSYRTVCKSLLGMGVEISPQALRSWYVRRTQKIARRSSVLPSRAFNSSTAIPVKPLQSSLFSNQEEGAAVVVRQGNAICSASDDRLAVRIQAEEQKLAAPALVQNYLLPKKKPLHS